MLPWTPGVPSVSKWLLATLLHSQAQESVTQAFLNVECFFCAEWLFHRTRILLSLWPVKTASLSITASLYHTFCTPE